MQPEGTTVRPGNEPAFYEVFHICREQRFCCFYFIMGSTDECNHYNVSIPVGYHVFKTVISSNSYSKLHGNPCHLSGFP